MSYKMKPWDRLMLVCLFLVPLLLVALVIRIALYFWDWGK